MVPSRLFIASHPAPLGGTKMQLIEPKLIQRLIEQHSRQDMHIHLEMTTGAYAAHNDSSKHPASIFITNAVMKYAHGSISGNGPYRVGLKMNQGWVYIEGLTHYDETQQQKLILAGHDGQGKLVVCLILSREPI
jgi:hypothetical protein